MTDIPKVFENEDTIYHYTKSQTAIEYILFEKQLRQSSRKISDDPFENSNIGMSGGGENITKEIEGLGKKMMSVLEKREKALRQVCFCMNNPEIDPKENEYYGFLKPRMWDQYGDNYKGICLAFDKKELIKQKFVELKKEVNYVKYKDLESLHICFNDIEKMGYEEIKRGMIEKQNNIFLRKHQDYSGENEYRMGAFSEEEFEYLNIEKSIRGIIIIPKYINNYTFQVLKKYANDIALPLQLVYFNHDGFETYTLPKESTTRIENGRVVYHTIIESKNNQLKHLFTEILHFNRSLRFE
jgi:hypothetical protein